MFSKRDKATEHSTFWKTIRYSVLYLIILLAGFFATAIIYKNKNFGDSKIGEILFYFSNGLMSGQTTSLWEAAEANLWLIALITFLMMIPVLDLFRNRITIHFNLSIFGGKKHKNFAFNPSKIRFRYKFSYAIVLLVGSVWFLLTSFGVPSYVASYFQTTKLYDQHYVDPSKVDLQFPAQKRNLIYIYMESMENTIASKQSGGQAPVSQIPDLEKLATNPKNISFSNQSTPLGGALPAYNTTWTVAGMTAQSAGIPLNDPLGDTGTGAGNSMGALKQFLPGAYTLGDALKKAGYNNSFVMGSDEGFGGRGNLLTEHGDYNIIDLNAAKRLGYLPQNYHVWWGYEDSKVFEYAKDEVNRLAKQDKPFNLDLLTSDTHFVDGYLESSCPTPFNNQYANVWNCSSHQITDFIAWAETQPWADNTTIILSGDHLGMQTVYYDNLIKVPNYQRTIYNVFINSAVQPVNSDNRLFTTMDMYPSTLAAMGVKIPGNQLGLGVNLFSDQKTLTEQLGGINQLNQELSKRSPYYDKNILQAN